MSPMAVVYLMGMALVFVGERMLGGHETARWLVTLMGLGAVAAAAGFGFRAMQAARDPGLRLGRRITLICLGVSLAALVLYALTTQGVVEALGLEGEVRKRWKGVFTSLWPVSWLLGAVPLLLVDHAMWRSPVIAPPARVRQALATGLAAALGVALVFPVNYIATRNNERWDLTYQKTTAAGTATLAVAMALEQPVNVRIFLPPASDLADELRGYFAALEGGNLTVEVVDQAANPRLARALRVRDNGVITFTLGDVVLEGEGEAPDPAAPKPITKTYDVGKDLDKARRKLKTLDQEVHKLLLEIGQADRVVYFTTGHGELTWEGKGEPDRSLSGVKRLLQAMRYRVETISIADGLGEAIPDDADVVAVVGPRERFQPAEIDALRAFLESGGSLLIAHEPDAERGDPMLAGAGPDPLVGFMAELGLAAGEGVLAAEGGYVPVWHAKRDRTNLVTNRFSIHPSTKVLAENSANLLLFHPSAGFWDQVDGAATKVIVTVRSLPISWADLDGNLELNESAGEAKKERSVVAAVTPAESGDWRALALADAGILSDLALGNLGNQRFVHDGMNWLIGAEALSGTTENEEDVKIEHTKEDQTVWFYSTVLGVPLLVLVGGVLRLRSRRRGGGR